MSHKHNDVATMCEECPHCGIQQGEHHTGCPNYSPGNVQVVINTTGWERCVSAYLYSEAWGVWLDRPPVALFGDPCGG